MQEFKAEFGQTLVTAYAKIGGHAVGIVANQKQRCRTAGGELQIGGVIYPDAADKAARFVMDCNQMRAPIVFLQDVQGFMVGKQAEQAGIMRQATQGHMTLDLVGKLAARANVKTVALSHLTQRFGSDDYTPWAEEVKKNFSGQVIVAEDLMEF